MDLVANLLELCSRDYNLVGLAAMREMPLHLLKAGFHPSCLQKRSLQVVIWLSTKDFPEALLRASLAKVG